MGSYEYILEVGRNNIDFVNKIIEAHEGIGVLKTIDRQKGIVSIITTDSYILDVKKLIENLINYGIEIKYIQGIWKG